YSRNAEAPALTKDAVAVASAVDEVDLRLKTVAPGWQRNRHRKIARAGVQFGREFLADAVQRAAPLGKRDDSVGTRRAACHRSLSLQGSGAYPSTTRCLNVRRLWHGSLFKHYLSQGFLNQIKLLHEVLW